MLESRIHIRSFFLLTHSKRPTSSYSFSTTIILTFTPQNPPVSHSNCSKLTYQHPLFNHYSILTPHSNYTPFIHDIHTLPLPSSNQNYSHVIFTSPHHLTHHFSSFSFHTPLHPPSTLPLSLSFPISSIPLDYHEPLYEHFTTHFTHINSILYKNGLNRSPLTHP